jgi:hypothetical protein
MTNEPNILEQISSKRRGAEVWLRDAGDYVRDYRAYLKAGRLSRDDVQEAIEVLDALDGAGFAYFDDLDRLLNEASRLSASELRAAEPKFSRAKPILARAENVLEQIEPVHNEIVSFVAALNAHTGNRLTITKDDLILRGDPAIPSQLPRLSDEKRNALISSGGQLNVEVAEGTPQFCVPECDLMSLKGTGARVSFTSLVVHQSNLHMLAGSYYPDLGGIG